jgi:hypothetical protein
VGGGGGGSDGLSKGAKAALGVGVTIFALALIGAIWFAVTKWRRIRRGMVAKSLPEDGYSMPDLPRAGNTQPAPMPLPRPMDPSQHQLAGGYRQVGSPHSPHGRDVLRELDRELGGEGGGTGLVRDVSPDRGRGVERLGGGDYRDGVQNSIQVHRTTRRR